MKAPHTRIKKKNTGAKEEFSLSSLLPSGILAAVFVIWGYFVLKNYYANFPVNLSLLKHVFAIAPSPGVRSPSLNVLGEHALCLFYLSVILLGALGAGSTVTKRAKLFETFNMENIIFSAGLGLGVIMLYVFIAGILGVLYKLTVIPFLAAFAFIGITRLKEAKFRIEKKSFGEKFFLLILLALTVINFVSCLAPATFYDALVYHLSVPLYWVQHHKISMIPNLFPSNYALNIQLLFCAALFMADETLCSMIHISLGILVTMGIYVFCRKYFNRRTGMFAAVIFYSIPLVSLITIRTGITMGLGFYELLAVFSFINWSSGNEKKWLWLSAVFAGIELGGKYASAFCVAALSLAIFLKIMLFDRGKLREAMKKAFLFGLISILVASPWFIKNLANTGNPLFPFLSDKIGRISPRRWQFGDPPPYPLNFKSVITIPWKLAMGKLQEGFSGPIFLFLLPLVFLGKKLSRTGKLLWAYFIPTLILWITVGRVYLRYFIPTLPVFSIILSYYLLGMKISDTLKRALIFVCSAIFLTNMILVLFMVKVNRDPLSVALGYQTKSDYLNTQRPSYPNPYYIPLEWADRNIARDAKILFIGECRGYYSPRKFVTATAADHTPIVEYTKRAADADMLREILKKEGVTHFLVSLKEASRLKSYNMFYWTEGEFRVFCEFWDKYVRQLYCKNSVFLYEILSPDEALKAHEAPVNYISELQGKGFELPEIYALYWTHGKWDELEDEYTSFLAQVTSREAYVYYLTKLADVCIQKGSYGKAAAIHEQILKYDPQNRYSQNQLELLASPKDK